MKSLHHQTFYSMDMEWWTVECSYNRTSRDRHWSNNGINPKWPMRKPAKVPHIPECTRWNIDSGKESSVRLNPNPSWPFHSSTNAQSQVCWWFLQREVQTSSCRESDVSRKFPILIWSQSHRLERRWTWMEELAIKCSFRRLLSHSFHFHPFVLSQWNRWWQEIQWKSSTQWL